MRSKLYAEFKSVMLSALTLTLTFSPISNCFAAVPARLNSKTLESSPSVAAPLTAEAKKARVSEQYGKMPLHFEPNRGQSDRQVEYLSRGQGYTLLLTRREAILSLSAGEGKGAALRMRPVGANTQPEIVAEAEQEGRSNYLLGNDQSKWQSDVPHYGRVRYAQVYPGIDMVYYGKQGQLEYDFVVAPGADPSRIKLQFDGIKRLKVNGQGDLVMEIAGGGEMKQGRPVVYQEIGGERREVEARFDVRSKREVGFELGTYDTNLPLVIDPVLAYSTFIGGNQDDSIQKIEVDGSGNVFVVGSTTSANFPTTAGAFQTSHAGGLAWGDIFVAKLNSTGSALLYSTFLGGSGDDIGFDIAVDGAGNAYVIGTTTSTSFPTTPGAFQTSHRMGALDAFVAKLNVTGSALVYSSYLGGSGTDVGYGIAVDNAGNAYVTGVTSSPDLYTTSGAFQMILGGSSDVFVAKMDAKGSALVYSTYLGKIESEVGNDIAVDTAGNIYISGT